MSAFVELSLIMLIASSLSLIMRFLKQPLIIAYILAGIVAGPLVLDIIQSADTLALFSKIGITILLFIIGLHLNPKIIREVGWVSLVTGVGQILFTSLFGFSISLLLGNSFVESVFISLALTFSSTIIILKLLHDKGDLEKLYGKISVGFLLVQDIAASLILLSVSLFAQQDSVSPVAYFSIMAIKVIGLALGLVLFSRYILPKLISLAAKSQETLFLFCISWGMIISTLFVVTGLSVEIGALVAGVTLSTTAFATEISSRLRPLRDFFIVIFFILLGSNMVIDNFTALLIPALVFSIFVLVGNPLIVFYLMNLLGYHKRTSFLAGLTVAQISEFSLILITLGQTTNFVSEQTVAMVTLVGLITIGISSYMILYSNYLYEYLNPILSLLIVRTPKSARDNHLSNTVQAILFGYGRVGQDYLRTFKKLKTNYLIVDFDPKIIDQLQAKEIPSVYGDAEDIEFMTELPLDKVKIVVSSISDFETDLLIIKQTRAVNDKAVIVVKSNNVYHAQELYLAGATYVVMPHYIGANYAARLIRRKGVKLSAYNKAQAEHLQFLKSRLKLR